MRTAIRRDKRLGYVPRRKWLLWWKPQVIRVETQQLLVAADDAVAALADVAARNIRVPVPMALFNCVMASDVLVMEPVIGFPLRNWSRSVSRHAQQLCGVGLFNDTFVFPRLQEFRERPEHNCPI